MRGLIGWHHVAGIALVGRGGGGRGGGRGGRRGRGARYCVAIQQWLLILEMVVVAVVVCVVIIEVVG